MTDIFISLLMIILTIYLGWYPLLIFEVPWLMWDIERWRRGKYE